MPNGTKATAKDMQKASVLQSKDENRIPVTLRTTVGFEYHQTYAESVIRDLISPDVSDGFIEVEVPKAIHAVKRRFLHTSTIAEVDIHTDIELDV